MKFTTIKIVLTATFVGTAMVGVLVTSAQADMSQCSSGYVCKWDEPDFNGNIEVQNRAGRACDTGDNPPNFDVPFAFSVWNRSETAVRFWSNEDCTGESFVLQSGESSSNVPIPVVEAISAP